MIELYAAPILVSLMLVAVVSISAYSLWEQRQSRQLLKVRARR